jgi:DNA-binding beta-propeller fold protein YncE
LRGHAGRHAGTGERVSGGNGGLAIETPLVRPTRLAIDPDGNLVVFDAATGFRKIDGITGVITALNPFVRLADDRARQGCHLSDLDGMAYDIDGGLLFSRSSAVCRLTRQGNVFLVGGTGFAGFSGDGGPADAATVWRPTGLAVDAAGAIYIAESGNNRIRKLVPVEP